jgi:hypothetical protein
MSACDLHIRAYGKGCCEACFEQDTHGLLDKFKVIDVGDHQQELENLTRLAAQAVIARGEHANAIRQCRRRWMGCRRSWHCCGGPGARGRGVRSVV